MANRSHHCKSKPSAFFSSAVRFQVSDTLHNSRSHSSKSPESLSQQAAEGMLMGEAWAAVAAAVCC